MVHSKQYHILLSGRPASKKTSARVIHAKGRLLIIPSKAHQNFHTQAMADLEIIKRLNKYTTIENPVRVDYEFHIKGRYDQDTANSKQTIDDILQDSGIILNDSQIIEGSFKKIRGCSEWETVITVTELDPTSNGLLPNVVNSTRSRAGKNGKQDIQVNDKDSN
jgi:Holliday junction resolvase RusA-like endonuclease